MIEYEHLEALLPDDILEVLEEQFLINKQVDVIVLLLNLLHLSAQIDCPQKTQAIQSALTLDSFSLKHSICIVAFVLIN